MQRSIIYNELGEPVMYADVLNQSPLEALEALIREALAITRAHLQAVQKRARFTV